jgi:hypothetical protein
MDDTTRKAVADVVRQCREGGYDVRPPPPPHQNVTVWP